MIKQLRDLLYIIISKNLDFRERIFNLFFASGVIIGMIMVISSLFTSTIYVTFLNLAAVVFALLILYYANQTKRYQFAYTISIVLIFLVIFPALFFENNGYKGAMLLFFIFAIVFTVFMLQGKRKLVFVGLELVVYIGVCIYAYVKPESITGYASEWEYFIDEILTLVSLSVALGITSSILLQMYDDQKLELERARQRLSEENALLDRVNYLKSEFLGNVSHELKTPLTVIAGYAQTVQMNLFEKNDTETAAKQLMLIASEAERIALMVNQLLDATRIEENSMVISPVKTSITELIQKTLSTYFPILNKNNNKLHMRLPYDIPYVLADPARIVQVIVNLLSNAIQYTKDGEIIISAAVLENFVEVSISDTGVGIAPERMPLLFERYKSYDSGNTEKNSHTGTGLGLFICNHLIEAHGGKLQIESELGEGTTVRFVLPLLEEFYS